MQPNDGRLMPGIEMTTYCLTNLRPQVRQVLCFGKNGLSQRSRQKAAFRCFFNKENQFVHFDLSFNPESVLGNQNTGSASLASTAAEAFSTSAWSELPCASIVTMAGKSVTRRCHMASGMPNSSRFTSSTSLMDLA